MVADLRLGMMAGWMDQTVLVGGIMVGSCWREKSGRSRTGGHESLRTQMRVEVTRKVLLGHGLSVRVKRHGRRLGQRGS